MTTQTLPYEILLRFADGKLSGAHYVEISRYLDDAGELITEKIGNAQPIPTELSESILGAVNTAALARIAELEAQLAAVGTPEVPANSLISNLHAAFTSTLPPEAQVAFAAPYAIVRTLVQADQMQLAADYIASVPVPPELEEAKRALINLIAQN